METLDDPAEVLRTWLTEQQVGSDRPVLVVVRRDADSDDREAWFFEIVLTDPAIGDDTWAPEDLNRLQRGARDRALELGLTWPWYLRFRPVSDQTPQEPEAEGRD